MRDTAVDEGIQNTIKFQSAWHAAIPVLQSAAEWEQTFKAVVEDQKAFDEFDTKINQHIASIEGQAEAIGRVAQEQAKNTATLESLKQRLADINEQYTVMRTNFGDLNPRTHLSVCEKRSVFILSHLY